LLVALRIVHQAESLLRRMGFALPGWGSLSVRRRAPLSGSLVRAAVGCRPRRQLGQSGLNPGNLARQWDVILA
jgi:hypothetical protein